MKLNESGKVIHREWMHTGDIRPNVELAEVICHAEPLSRDNTINTGKSRDMARHVPTPHHHSNVPLPSNSACVGCLTYVTLQTGGQYANNETKNKHYP